MIAQKNSPIWVRLNKTFGTPYPPFDWGSGMGVLDISRREAIRLGVITDEEIKREVADLREKEKQDFGMLSSLWRNPERAWLDGRKGHEGKKDRNGWYWNLMDLTASHTGLLLILGHETHS